MGKGWNQWSYPTHSSNGPVCYNCGGVGHVAANCPSAKGAKGKGKSINQVGDWETSSGTSYQNSAGAQYQNFGGSISGETTDWDSASAVGLYEVRRARDNPICSMEVKDKIVDGWERVPVKVDSGAIDSCTSKMVGKAFPIQETPASASGMKYSAANGAGVGNYGERSIRGLTDSWGRQWG